VVITEFTRANPVPPLLFEARASRIGTDRLIRTGRAYRSEPPSSTQTAEPAQPDTIGAAEMDAPLSLYTVVVASAEQISCPLGEEAAILNLKNSVYYGMNPVGARVWELLKQPKSVSELRDVLLDEYEVDQERCAQDLLALLQKMRDEGLIEVRAAAAS